MKLSTLIIGLALPLACTNASADYTCKPISGTIQQLTPDPTCAIQQSRSAHFADVIFLPSSPTAPTCFSSTLLNTTLGSAAVTGTIYSGLIANNISNGVDQLTAASAIQIISGGVELGRVYTTDVVFDPYSTTPPTRELLTMVDGSRIFREGNGHFEVKGNALTSNTDFSGILCTEN